VTKHGRGDVAISCAVLEEKQTWLTKLMEEMVSSGQVRRVWYGECSTASVVQPVWYSGCGTAGVGQRVWDSERGHGSKRREQGSI
jgi:hypothetical protein